MKAGKGMLQMSLGSLSVWVPLTLEARNALAETMNPPIRGPLVESPLLTVRDAKAMRKRLRV